MTDDKYKIENLVANIVYKKNVKCVRCLVKR